MKKLITILLVFASVSVFAQKKENPLVQFTGVIFNADSTGVIVPFVNITNLSNKDAVYSANYRGYFSFVVREQDTLRFTAVGYAPVTLVIPSNIASKSYTTQVLIKPQINNLPVVRLFPWATTDEFRKDFVSARIADDDLEVARKNIMRAALFASQNTLPRDGHEIQSANANQFHSNIVNSHSITNPLLNPLAWGSLIKSIADGDKSRGTSN